MEGAGGRGEGGGHALARRSVGGTGGREDMPS